LKYKKGCGKTSYIQCLAGELKLDICLLSLSSSTLDDQGLNERLRDAPLKSIILLEDVDAIFVDRNVSDKASIGKKTVTFSGLLNAIDGIVII
jgi:mitochondrial chaperone BCS1